MAEKNENIKTVAIISPGDMGHAIGRFILERTDPKMRVITNLTGRSHRTCQLSELAGIVDVQSDDEIVQQADIVLSIVTTWEASAVAKRLTTIVQKKKDFLFVDMNDLAPETVVSIASDFSQEQFVDGSIIGGPPQDDGYSPSIYLSGERANELDFLKNQCGLNVHVISKRIGDASIIKMCYAPMFKSVTAIGIQGCVIARRYGLEEIFLNELKNSLPDIYNMLRTLIPGISARASRWIGEMDQINATYRTMNLSTSILDSTVDIYRQIINNAQSDIQCDQHGTFEGTLEGIGNTLNTHQLNK